MANRGEVVKGTVLDRGGTFRVTLRTKPAVRLSDHIVSTKNISRILVGLDGSESSFEAADYVILLYMPQIIFSDSCVCQSHD